ncbi:MAG: endonuclease/exonuclease/phosphatase family protein, partial [Chloroflexota bacterium]
MFKFKNHKLHFLTVISAAYFLSIIVWLLLWLIIQDGLWWLVLINRFAFYLFAPVPVLLLLTAVFKHWRWFAALLFPAALFIWLYAPYVIPKPANDTKPDFKVLTYNVLHENRSYDQVAQIILSYSPDFVALQEVRPEMMVAIQERLDEEYPHSKLGDHHDYGTTAVLSRHPLTNSYSLDLKEDRPAAVVTSEINGQPVMFISAHLNPYGLFHWPWLERPGIVNLRTQTQNRQVEILLETIDQFDGTILLACDCNSLETSRSMRMLQSRLQNSSREFGWRPFANAPDNLKVDDNLRRIDYVWHNGKDLQTAGAYLLNDWGGSDHAPLLVEFV